MANFLFALIAPHNPHHTKRASQVWNVRKIQNLRFNTSDSNTESNSIDSKDSQKQNLESSFLESNQLTESTTSKNLCEALPNDINSVRVSASRAESMPIDSAIFAEQKSNQCVGAIAPTDTRPCRGGKNQEKGGSSATADFCLDKDKRGTLPVCRAEGLQAKRSKNSGGFFGAKGSGEGINPFSFCANTRF